MRGCFPGLDIGTGLSTAAIVSLLIKFLSCSSIKRHGVSHVF
jgi:hypothetical protein